MRQTHVVVANRFQFSNNYIKAHLSSIRFNSTQVELHNHALIEVTGSDRESFFQGQVTNDLLSLEFQDSQVSARLNRTGKLQSFFTIARLEDKLLILCEKSLVENILTDFKKFIIMDEVELKLLDEKVYIHFNYFLSEHNSYLFKTNFYGINSSVTTHLIVNKIVAKE